MARIYPFPALRYNPERAELSQVVTQPYDKITPEMQGRYYRNSPCNLVRIILGKSQAGDDGRNDVYTRAAAFYEQWRQDKILMQDAAPGLYLYSQTFRPPGNGREYERRGLIALGQLEDYERGVVFRHEQTLSHPKADRLNLLRATRAHFEQLLMLYSDPLGEIEGCLSPEGKPQINLRDEYGVLNQVWTIRDAEIIEAIRRKMRDKKLIIADGHHRYETALNYRDQRRAVTATNGTSDDAPFERVMMTFVKMESEGLVILPTHRVVFGLPGFDWQRLMRAARKYFDVEELGQKIAPARITSLLSEAGSQGTAIVAASAGHSCLLRFKPGSADEALSAFSPRQRRLDVVLLHKILLQRVLGISEESIRKQEHIAFVREINEALQQVSTGANVAFLMNPVTVEQVREIAFAGEVMPQKSTDFYPKLLSGLVMYALE